MSRAMNARKRALDAMGALDDDSDELVALGDKKAIPSGDGAVYYPYPQPHARNRNVEPSTPAAVFLHPPTSALIVVPTLGSDPA